MGPLCVGGPLVRPLPLGLPLPTMKRKSGVEYVHYNPHKFWMCRMADRLWEGSDPEEEKQKEAEKKEEEKREASRERRRREGDPWLKLLEM